MYYTRQHADISVIFFCEFKKKKKYVLFFCISILLLSSFTHQYITPIADVL